jgi:hypothetical protein
VASLIVLGPGATACDRAAPSPEAGTSTTSAGTTSSGTTSSGTTSSGTITDRAGGGASGGPAPSGVRVVQVIVTGREVRPAPSRVEIKVGELLRLQVTSDHDDELHVHGFEVERELTAGKPALIELRGERPGLYEVETHNPALRLLQVLVR